VLLVSGKCPCEAAVLLSTQLLEDQKQKVLQLAAVTQIVPNHFLHLLYGVGLLAWGCCFT
jgi:hypothetical protein